VNVATLLHDLKKPVEVIAISKIKKDATAQKTPVIPAKNDGMQNPNPPAILPPVTNPVSPPNAAH